MTRLFYIFWLRVCVSWVCVSAGCVCVCVSLVSQELKRDCTTHRWLWEWKERRRRRPKSRSTSSTTRHTHQSSCVCVCVLRCATTDTHARWILEALGLFFFFQISSEHVPTFCSSPYKKLLSIFCFFWISPTSLVSTSGHWIARVQISSLNRRFAYTHQKKGLTLQYRGSIMARTNR